MLSPGVLGSNGATVAYESASSSAAMPGRLTRPFLPLCTRVRERAVLGTSPRGSSLKAARRRIGAERPFSSRGLNPLERAHALSQEPRRTTLTTPPAAPKASMAAAASSIAGNGPPLSGRVVETAPPPAASTTSAQEMTGARLRLPRPPSAALCSDPCPDRRASPAWRSPGS